MSDIPAAARPHMDEAGSILDRLFVHLDDESVPAMARVGAATTEGQKIEAALQAAISAGLAQDHPAVTALIARGEQLGPKLAALASAGAAGTDQAPIASMDGIPEAARPHLEEAEAILDRLMAHLDDDSVSAMERLGSAASEGQKLEAALQGAIDAGLEKEHAAVGALTAKVQQLGPRLEQLAAAGKTEVAQEPVPAPGEGLGRAAAGLEKDCYQAFADLLADRPPEAEVAGRVGELRDEWIRRMWVAGRERAELDEKGTRDFQWGLVNELKQAKELRSLVGGELCQHYATSPIRAVLEEVYNLNRFLEEGRLSPADRERLAGLGLLPVSD